MKVVAFHLMILTVFLLAISCSKEEQSSIATKKHLGQALVSNEGMGALESVIDIGPSDEWNVKRENKKLWLENNSDANSIRYYYAADLEGAEADRGATVLVDVRKASNAGRAGLLYGYQNTPLEYWLIVVGKEGVLEVFRRDANGLAMRSSQSVGPAKNGEYALEIQETGKVLKIKVNGRATGHIESDSIGKGALGVAALSSGSFGFNGFRQFRSGKVNTVQSLTNSSSVQGSVQTGVTIQPESNPLQAQTSGKAVEFSEEVIRDEGRQNFPAYTVLVPRGWKLDGYVRPAGPALFNIPYISDITVKAPNSNFVHFYPELEFGFNDQVNGVPMKQVFDGRFFMRMPESIGQLWTFLANMDPERSITNINIVSEEVIPDATKYVRKASASLYKGAAEYNQTTGFSGTRFTFDTHVRRLVIRYRYKGKEMEELLFATLSSSFVRYSNGSVKAAMWGLRNTYSIGGPVGSGFQEDPVLATVVRSRRVNKDWAYVIDRFYQNQKDIIIKQGLAAIAASKNNWKNTTLSQSDDVLDISFNGWKKRSGMRDAGQAKSVNGIHERTTYATPSGSQVNLPSYYQQVYTDGQGNYLLHNDANYQINSDPNFNQRNWQQVQPVR